MERFMKYVGNNIIVALIVTIIGGLGLYSIQIEKEREDTTKKLVIDILKTYDNMEYQINNEYMDMISLQSQILTKLLELKLQKYENNIESPIKFLLFSIEMFDKVKNQPFDSVK